MKIICPNLNNAEVKLQFDELKNVLGEEVAYYVWSYNNGNSLDYAPNGALSKLFSDLLEHYKGDRVSAIIAKAKTYSPEFRNWFGDWLSENKENMSKVVDENYEPLIVYHGGPKGITEFLNPKDIDKKYAGLHSTVLNRKNLMGIYFINKLNVAEQYAEAYRKNKMVYPVFINAKNIKNIKQVLFYGLQFLKNIVKLWNLDFINYQDIKTYDVNKLYELNIDCLTSDSWSKSKEFIVFNSNQIKSVDNRGTYSIEDNNIYQYAIDSVVNRVSGEDGMYILFNDTTTNAKSVLDNMILSDMFFDSNYQLQIASQLLNNIGESVNIELDFSNPSYEAAYQNGKISVNAKIFNRFNNKDIGRIILHELLHHFTINEYNNNSSFKTKIDDSYNKINKLFPSNKYNRKNGLYYGLTSPEEFISEIYTNSAFRDLVAKKNMSTWRRILSNILRALKLNKIALKVELKGVDNTIALTNEISDIINGKRTTDINANTLGDGILKYDANNDLLLNDIEKEAHKANEKIIRGLKASYRSLKSRDKSPVYLAKLQLTIDDYELLYLKNEDTEILIKFILRSSELFSKVLPEIRKAYLDPSSISNDTLLNIKSDFLDFYGYMCDDINEKLLSFGYFDNLDLALLEKIKTDMDLINRAYVEIKGKYTKILKERASEIVYDIGYTYGVPKKELDNYVSNFINNDDSNYIDEDISSIAVWLRPTRSLKDLIMRLTFRSTKDINSDVQFFANNKALELIREFSKINKKDQLLYFEKDKNGKPTGYLIRDRRYGEFKKDLQLFNELLDAKYGVVDGNYYSLSDDDFSKYIQEKEKWLLEHCERKFKKEYYELYSKLKPATRLRLKSLNGEIQSILDLEGIVDKDGIHLEKLSDSDWRKLSELYRVKRNLSNIYDFYGNLKVGEDREIAEDLTQFYEKIGSGNISSLKLSKEEINDLIEQKRKELTPEMFEKWLIRNISYLYTEEFLDLIKSDVKMNSEDQKVYDELIETRRKLMLTGRHNSLPRTESTLLTNEVKDKIKELDIEIDSIRSKYSSGKSFKDYAKMILTPLYKIDLELAKKKGPEKYKEWYDRSHYISSRGTELVVSYYKMLVPKDSKYYEAHLSRMNLELDKESPLVNPKYDFNNPEYYQPKLELYDNREAFEKATNTKNKRDIYNLIYNTIEEANNKIPFLSKRDNYKLPLMTGDIVDFTCRGNKFWKGIRDWALDGILIKSDDSDYAIDNYTLKPDGSKLLFIPTHYLKMLDNPEYISRNLVGMLTEYSKMAENFRLKNKRISEYELLSQQIGDKTFTLKDNITKTLEEKKGIETNLYKKLNLFIDMNFYGLINSHKNSTIKIGDKVISFTKIINNIKRYASASNLGNNLAAITKALFLGLHKSTVEALSGRYFNSTNYYKALANTIFNIPRMLFNLGNARHDYLPLALLEKNNIAINIDDKTKYLQYNRIYRLIQKYLIWGGWQAIDYLVKAPVVLAIYADYKYIPEYKTFMSRRKYIMEIYNDNWKDGNKAFDKINTFSLLDVYSVKNGKLVIKDQYKKYLEAINDINIEKSVKNTSEFITNRIDGILSQEEKTAFMTNAVGACVMMHRSFFINNMENNIFAEYLYNPFIEDYYEAKYRSSFKVLWNWISNLFKATTRNDNKNLNKIESILLYNFKSTVILLSLVGMYMLLIALWLKPAADDDKDSYVKNFIGYSLDAFTFEERAEYNPMDLFNQIKSPSAAIAPIENVTNIIKIFDPISFENNFKEVNKGPYKGMERWLRSLIKATPGLRGIWESRDVRTKWEYLNTLLKK